MKQSLLYTAFGILVSAVAFTGCSTEDIDTYSGVQSGIFIQQVATTDIAGNPTSYRDSIAYSFSSYGEDVTYLRTSVVIRTIGPTTDYDRPYKVEVVPEETNGVEGVDFDLSENASVIKAGMSTDNFYIRMLRTPKLSQGTRIKVKIRIVPNEYFTIPITELKNSSAWNVDGDMLTTTSYIVTFSEEYTLPWPWTLSSYWPAYFGSFSAAKMKVVNNVMGYTYLSWSDGTVAYGKLPYMADATQKYLQSMADAGTPVLDEDGSYMQLASGYMVNYNAYVTDDNE